MCGINGFVERSNGNLSQAKEKINAMNNLILHRGPDEEGTFVEQLESDIIISLGMQRLSIIDLNNGSQPIYGKNGKLVIVFNGEIYNYRVLKNALVARGVHFETNSDTEVILKLYETEGESSFAKLDGMYAFSIFDKEKGKVFIARDFFGEKPLYYYKNNHQFVWASELKSLLPQVSKPEISKKGLNLYLRLGYIPAPHTIYGNINKLEANHFIQYNLEDNCMEIKKIQSDEIKESRSISFSQAKKEVKELVEQSVESRSISDVPLGTFLSGGVDSSIVSLCLSRTQSEKINTFSIGFKKSSFDESDKSRLVAKMINSNHNEFIIDEEDLENDIHQILDNFDEPFSDAAALPTYLVSKKTREHVKVALTGDGGDEVFGGYNKYYVGKLNQRYTNIVPKGLHTFLNKISAPLLRTPDDKKGRRYKAKRMMQTIDYNGEYYWDIISLGNTQKKLQGLLLEKNYIPDLFLEYKQKTGIDKPVSLTHYREIDRVLSLEGGMLPKVDRTSMLASLECRAPFLNKALWNYTNSLPEDFLLKGWSKKHILKEAFKEDFPGGFLEKSKRGFNTPVGDWLRSGLCKELESYIDSKFLENQQIFNVKTAQKLVGDHITGKEDNSDAVWTFYCFQKWYYNHYLKS
ncbi:asparagine synthase (glutamine-hydrolyzing) [Flagellimonas olearia]|uniref:asparagine synthase (glutamine-hydrolyzing) n=1 Tax=Flagellimonas olearia TaxID=552546 RepID=A0A6I1E034_9FLAO|nr:asparagine synthase (glutamine-hydrolyzing) [Allomuricauda olearia]KAB7530487.1 asparagine synthase (glutamine-hydrolyzing) [Allomuricauda olearia]